MWDQNCILLDCWQGKLGRHRGYPPLLDVVYLEGEEYQNFWGLRTECLGFDDVFLPHFVWLDVSYQFLFLNFFIMFYLFVILWYPEYTPSVLWSIKHYYLSKKKKLYFAERIKSSFSTATTISVASNCSFSSPQIKQMRVSGKNRHNDEKVRHGGKKRRRKGLFQHRCHLHWIHPN